MSTIFENNAQSIGNTPLVRLAHLAPNGNLLAKVEGRNPAFSIKDRVALFMVREAEKNGLLRCGMTIVEPTSGNTGIGLAMIAKSCHYGCILTMPESMSLERRKVLMMLGARLSLTPADLGMQGAIDEAARLCAAHPDRYFMPQQFNNPANPLAHEETTAPELWEATDGSLDMIVAAVGTGGTITGIARYWKRKKPNFMAVAVEPDESAVLSQYRNHEPLRPGAHGIQGIGAGFVPSILDLSLIDCIERVSTQQAIDTTRLLAAQEGILAGVSSGAALCAALRMSSQYPEKRIAVILPDLGERYMSHALYTELSQRENLLP